MDEYVQYHKPEYADFPVEEPGPFSIYTNKPAESVGGARVWLVARRDGTSEYYLVYWFVVDEIVEGHPGEPKLIKGRSGAWLRPAVRIDQRDWFDAFLRYVGNFGLGLQRIADPDLAAALRDAGGVGKHSFSHVEVFPPIARLIVTAAADGTEFVTHDQIVAAILADGRAAEIVARARTSSSLADDRGIASNMVAWFSQQITVGRSRWVEFFDRERREDAWAYRPRTAMHPPIAPDIELSAIEAEPRMFFHVRRERDSALARAKREAVRAMDGRLTCEACGLVAQARYPGLPGDICEVHHRRPLAEASEPVETHLDDLAVLCANCHRAIYQTTPLMSVDDFRSRFLSSTRREVG